MGHIICVTRGDTIYAIISQNSPADASGFFTPPEALLQAGVVDLPDGYFSKAHAHREMLREIRQTCEVLFVAHGGIVVEIFDEAWQSLAQETLGPGDCIALMRGGHSVRTTKATRLVEVKQGPYPGVGDAKIFRDPT